MKLPYFDYEKPATLDEALDAMQEYGKNARILAGGTDLLVNMKYRSICPERVIAVKSIPELCRISSGSQGETSIGACVTLSDLAADPAIAEKFPAFSQAVKSVASKHVRNMASIGGNICLDTRCWHYHQSQLYRDADDACHKLGGNLCHAIKGSDRCHAINSSDTAPILMALDAVLRVAKKGHERDVPAETFFKDNGAQPTVLESDEILASLVLPKQNVKSYTTFTKIATRRGIDFATGNIAVRIQQNGKAITDLRLIIGAMTSAPRILEKTSEVIMESGLTDKAIEKAAATAPSELGTLTNLYSSAGYKRHLAGVLVKRALLELQSKTRGKKRGSK